MSIPLLPVMYYQGKRIQANVPKLSEAEGTTGLSTANVTTDKSLRIISIGESTIAGVGVDTHQEGFTGTLANELASLFETNVYWQVYARSGYTAERVARKLVPTINEKQIDLIIIGLGGNDAFTLNRPNKWRKDVRGLIEKLRAKYMNTPIVFCNMPPIKEFPAFTPLIKFTVGNLVEILGEELKALVHEYEDVFYFAEILTLEKWMKKLEIDVIKADFFSDGVHPSKLTYQTWAQHIASGIYHDDELKNALQNRLSANHDD